MQEVPKVHFRDITEDDLPFLRKVYGSTRETELSVVDWSEAQKRDFLDMQFKAQHKYYQDHYGDASFQIICAGKEEIGRLYLQRRKDDLRIVDIALLPAWRGKGIGGKILKDIQAEARLAGKQVSIHVEHNNPALRLYQKLGFIQEGDTGVYYFMVWRP